MKCYVKKTGVTVTKWVHKLFNDIIYMLVTHSKLQWIGWEPEKDDRIKILCATNQSSKCRSDLYYIKCRVDIGPTAVKKTFYILTHLFTDRTVN